MIKQEMIELVTKWWKNKLNKHFDDLLKIAQADDKFHDRIEPLQDAISKLDAFKNNLEKQLLGNKGNYIVLSIYNSTYSTDLNCALVNSDINIPLVFDITTIITNDNFLLIRYPMISYSSILKITDENSLLCLENWD